MVSVYAQPRRSLVWGSVRSSERRLGQGRMISIIQHFSTTRRRGVSPASSNRLSSPVSRWGGTRLFRFWSTNGWAGLSNEPSLPRERVLAVRHAVNGRRLQWACRVSYILHQASHADGRWGPSVILGCNRRYGFGYNTSFDSSE